MRTLKNGSLAGHKMNTCQMRVDLGIGNYGCLFYQPHWRVVNLQSSNASITCANRELSMSKWELRFLLEKCCSGCFQSTVRQRVLEHVEEVGVTL